MKPENLTVQMLFQKFRQYMAPFTSAPMYGHGEREQAIANRQSIVPTLANLTLLNLKVNREAQNKTFATKQKLLIKNTNLRLNIDLLGHDFKSWDEKSIKKRSEKLAKSALCVWPGER